ncbi:MAG: bifunctional aspartate transaminase/aspartate 4-decarboxylase, partial [Gammaproteobacteria bacterium]|nr:bifunctional aspartate transaminase/aspartate 4-decarboxylase [Gammaproteobacteria bacterium]
MRKQEEKKYEQLSPFELKNKLIQLAKTHADKMMLNAGRGNPNWVATTPREAFFQLGLFALREAERTIGILNLGGKAEKDGITARFLTFVKQYPDDKGVNL